MIEKLSVEKIHPRLVKHVREVAKGKTKAKHPIYDVSEHVGTGKATCRGCGEFIKEGEPALLFWQAPYDSDHKLHFFRNRSVIHAQGCLEGDLIRCPHCRDEVADGSLGQHINDAHTDRFQWKVIRRASIKRVCLTHKVSHCGQCEEDRELEEPKFREEVQKLLKIETASLSDQELVEYFDEPEGFVEDPLNFKEAAGYRPQRSTRDVAQEVTDKMIAALESGVVPWKRPWASANGTLPTSVHGRPYRGINLLLLGLSQQANNYKSPYWITYEQAKKMGGNVKRGEKATMVTFRKPIKVVDRNAVPAPGEDPKMKSINLLKHYSVFNTDQTEGITLPPRLQTVLDTPKPQIEILPSVTQIIEGYSGGPTHRSVPMSSWLNDAPHYSHTSDEIVLPEPHQFSSPEAYAGTMFHELTHSTGHSSRLDRFADTGFPKQWGDETYANEELVAELGSAMLLGHTGIGGQDERNAGYIHGWLQKLKNDKNLIVKAASKAQSAVDHILGVDPSKFTDDEESQMEKESSTWRHTEDDGFEMWETTEDPNKFAIIENDDKYDLYVLNGSFDSPEEAKDAASTQKTAQDGGGGGSSGGGGGDGGGGGSAGSSGGGDGGASSGDGGTSSGEGGESSGDAGFSSGTTDSDADSSVDDGDSDDSDDGDEDPRPPSGGHENCPRCGEHLNPIYLVGGRVYTCMNCGFTHRRKKRIKDASWFDRIPHNPNSEVEPNEIIELSIEPRVPFAEDTLPVQPLKDRINSAELFSMSAARYRHCVVCGKVLGRSTRGHYTGLCETHREHTGLVTHEYGSQDSREPHNE